MLHASELLLPPPIHLPDLYAALFSLFGAANLCVIYATTVVGLWNLPAQVATSPATTGSVGEKKKQKST